MRTRADDARLAERANMYAHDAEALVEGLTIAQSRAVRAAIARAFVIGFAGGMEDAAGVQRCAS